MYVSTEDVREAATQMTDTALEESVLEKLILRASRMFDLACGVDPGYFEAAAEDAEASTMIIYGDGTNSLRLPPFVSGSIGSVVYVNDYTDPLFVESKGYLILTDTNGVRVSPHYSAGWLLNQPVTVSAIWGWESTPDEVQQMVIEFVINIWRETDPASIKLVNIDGIAIRERMPPRVWEVCRRLRVKYTPAFV